MAYGPVFKAGYTNWDDQLYTYENHSVQSLSAANLKIIFGSFKMSNYHPLTELSIAVENSMFGARSLSSGFKPGARPRGGKEKIF